MALSSDRAREAYKTAWNVTLFLAWCCIFISIKTWEAAIQTVSFGHWQTALHRSRAGAGRGDRGSSSEVDKGDRTDGSSFALNGAITAKHGNHPKISTEDPRGLYAPH